MKVTFANKNIALIETDKAHEVGVPFPVITSARKKLNFIRSAPDEQTLRNWKSLHFEKLSGNHVGKHSIRLNDQWRIILHLNKNCYPNEVTIFAIEDYH